MNNLQFGSLVNSSAVKGVLFSVLLLCSNYSFAIHTVKVGGYYFPPFVNSVTGTAEGITISMLDLFNEAQSDFEFVFVATTSKRRHKDFEAKAFDMLLFENMGWGWDNQPLLQSKVFHTGREVFITLAKLNRNQSYFSSLEGKLLGGIKGYHYHIADLQNDPAILRSDYSLLMSDDHQTNIKLLLNGKIDVAISSREFIAHYLLVEPTLQSKLLISERFDQEYKHRILLRDGIKVTPEYINNLLNTLQISGELQHLLSPKH